MNFFDELNKINDEIEKLKSVIEYLSTNMQDIVADTIKHLDEGNEIKNRRLPDPDSPLIVQLIRGKASGLESQIEKLEEKKNVVVSSSIMSVIRGDIVGISNEISSLKARRETIIEKIVRASRFSTTEIIDLMDAFEFYYKSENYGLKTIIIPQDTFLVRNGRKSVMDRNEMDELVQNYKTDKTKRDTYILPMYVKDEQGIALNDNLLDITNGIFASDSGGVPFYVPEGNSVVINGKILNIFPYDVLAFLEQFVCERIDNPHADIKEAALKYIKADPKAISLSSDDPALENIYRKKRK